MNIGINEFDYLGSPIFLPLALIVNCIIDDSISLKINIESSLCIILNEYIMQGLSVHAYITWPAIEDMNNKLL